MLSAALTYAARGWRVHPLPANQKFPPQVGWKDLATNDPDCLKILWNKPNSNIAIACGKASNLVVLDFDCKNNQPGLDTLDTLEKQFGGLATLRAKTPSGGIHLYFTCPSIALGNKVGIMPGLDIRADGGYVVAPPSTTVEGSYEWLNEFPPADMPEELIATLLQSATANRSTRVESDTIPEGERNSTIFRHCCTLRAMGLEYEAAKLNALSLNQTKCLPPLPEKDVLQCLDSAWKYDIDLTLTDLGNCLRFVAQHGQDVRFIRSMKKWLVWDGAIWRPDETGEVERRAKKTVKSIWQEIGMATGEARQKELRRHAFISESSGKISAMMRLVESEYVIANVLARQLDLNPMLLAVRNGVIDLKTGVLQSPRREDYITRRIELDYNLGAECPTWERFLAEVTDGRVDLQNYLQLLAGYLLTGQTTEQSLFICHGTGANGKSTFLTTLQKLMGPYACQSPVEVLMKRTKSGPDPEVARLKGMRLVVSSETDEGQQFSEVTIKQLTGGDRLVARHLYQELIEFTPQHKLIISANHLPVISGSDHAIWRRIRVIPFTRRFDKDMDTSLPDKLEQELEGILAWAIRGCLLWQKASLDAPDIMKRAEKAYREDMDHVEGWLRERYERDPQAWVPFKALHEDYCAWQKETGSRAMGTKQFAQTLKEKGMTPHKCPQGRGYMGLKPKQWEVM